MVEQAEITVERLRLTAGRLDINLDALTSTGIILLDGEPFPVTAMTVVVAVGKPVQITATFLADTLEGTHAGRR